MSLEHMHCCANRQCTFDPQKAMDGVEVVRISEPGVRGGRGGIVQIHTTDPIYLQGMLNFKSKYIHTRVQTKYYDYGM